MVQHKAHVRLVDAEAEGDSRDDDLQRAALPRLNSVGCKRVVSRAMSGCVLFCNLAARGERERGEVDETSVVQFVRARAPCGLLAGGRAIYYKIIFVIRPRAPSPLKKILLLIKRSSSGGRGRLKIAPPASSRRGSRIRTY